MVGFRTNRGGARRRGFTLVELLVVVAVIALLLGLMVPALGGARESAREAICAAQQRRLHLATALHLQSRDNWLPGLNTTGRAYLRPPAQAALLGDTTPTTPTSVFDWISPIIGEEAGLSGNRAVRTKQIFESLGCPSARRENDSLYGSGSLSDYADFQSLLEREGIGQISYLSPAAFHLAGRDFLGEGTYRTWGWRGPAVPPDHFEPRFDLVGSPAVKVWTTDACRYLASPDRLDFDVNPLPRYFGSFTTGGPTYIASREFGHAADRPQFAEEIRPGAPRGSVYPDNARLTYRHKKRIQTMRLDGHAEALTEKESKTDAAPWYPTGSVYTGVNATDESRERYEEGEELP